MKYAPAFLELEEQTAWRRDKNHPLNKLMEKYRGQIYINNAKTMIVSKPVPVTKKRNTSFAPNYDWINV